MAEFKVVSGHQEYIISNEIYKEFPGLARYAQEDNSTILPRTLHEGADILFGGLVISDSMFQLLNIRTFAKELGNQSLADEMIIRQREIKKLFPEYDDAITMLISSSPELQISDNTILQNGTTYQINAKHYDDGTYHDRVHIYDRGDGIEVNDFGIRNRTETLAGDGTGLDSLQTVIEYIVDSYQVNPLYLYDFVDTHPDEIIQVRVPDGIVSFRSDDDDDTREIIIYEATRNEYNKLYVIYRNGSLDLLLGG